ncbi:hypothetical protein ACFR97_14045 [Haloplanus litoreus]|uniref:Uncharacterized protein n=1 Tax=Haloplanus litoreus TaxID=767515 RepID=A0ABD5ZXF8_9EURY
MTRDRDRHSAFVRDRCPTFLAATQTHDHESRPENRPAITLAWAFNDQDAPSEITIFDPQNEITTHWITIDKDYVYDLDETV